VKGREGGESGPTALGRVGGMAGRDCSARRNAAKGRKKFLTCLRYVRERERETAGVPATSQEFPKWQSRHPRPVPLLLTSSFQPRALRAISPSCPTSYPPFEHAAPALRSMSTLLHSRARLSGCCALFTPFHGVRGLYFRLTVKVNGTTSRGELPRRLTGTPNRNFDAYACPRVYTRRTLVRYVYTRVSVCTCALIQIA